MEQFGVADVDVAVSFYQAVADRRARAVLDFLIDHPDERFEGAAIATALGLPRHRDIAEATYAYGEAARAVERGRPWQESQLGYLMPADQAALLRQARDRASSSGAGA
jgi:hypothetical protein